MAQWDEPRLRVLVCALLFLLAAVCASAASAPAKIAVLSSGPSSAPFSDLLTLELSKLANVTVLERDQIEQIMAEQSLGPLRNQDAIRIGRLLNAEGMVLLEGRVAREEQELLSARLLAVRPGVTISEHQFAMPVADPLKWANEFARHLEGELPRLAVRAEEATPVSVANLRASTGTGDGLVLEREMTMLLNLRLAREPSVFLLERRSLETLQAEKAMAAEEEPFWSGAYVIDGIINRDVVSATEVTLHARVASPKGAPVLIERVGERSDLVSLVNDLVVEILVVIGTPGESEPWDPQRERRVRPDAAIARPGVGMAQSGISIRSRTVPDGPGGVGARAGH
jgi:hypothetical protein